MTSSACRCFSLALLRARGSCCRSPSRSSSHPSWRAVMHSTSVATSRFCRVGSLDSVVSWCNASRCARHGGSTSWLQNPYHLCLAELVLLPLRNDVVECHQDGGIQGGKLLQPSLNILGAR